MDTEIENGTSGIDDATEDDDGLPDIPISVDGTKHYSVTAYPDFVYNGESITSVSYTHLTLPTKA